MRSSAFPRGSVLVRVNKRRFAVASRVWVPAKKKRPPNMIKHPTRGWIRMNPNPKFIRKRYFISWVAEARYW